MLDIEATSGLTKEEIKSNYDALIDYSSPFFKGKLNLPTLPQSPEGIQHFEEVKDIFISFYILGAITLICAVIIVLYKNRKKDYQYLYISSLTSIILPTLVGLAMSIDFDTSFRVFHEIFFDNDYWIFDPIKDPIITMLPAEFFMHSAILIIFLVLLGSLILYLYHRKMKILKGIKYRQNKGLKL